MPSLRDRQNNAAGPSGPAPAIAAQAAKSAASESPKPAMTSASLTAALMTEFTETPVLPAPDNPSTPTLEPNPPAPGTEPSPGAAAPAEPAQALAALETPDPSDDADDETAWPDKAIGTVTGLRHERRELRVELKAEREARQKLEADLAAAKGQPAAAPAAAPQAGDTPEIAALRQKETHAEATVAQATQLLRKAARDPEGVLAQLQTAQVNLADATPEGAVAFLEGARDHAQRQLTTLVTERTVLAAEARRNDRLVKEQTDKAVADLAPELKDPTSDLAKSYAQTLETFPNMKAAPNGAMVALIHSLGLEALKAKVKKPAGNGHANTAALPKPAPRGVRPSNAPRLPAPGETSNGREAFKTYKASPTPENREKWLLATLNESS